MAVNLGLCRARVGREKPCYLLWCVQRRFVQQCTQKIVGQKWADGFAYDLGVSYRLPEIFFSVSDGETLKLLRFSVNARHNHELPESGDKDQTIFCDVLCDLLALCDFMRIVAGRL